MLRFFRLIRRKLIEEQKTRQYIWYALGEILLVVFGILIALQINNWNNERLNRELEQVYIQNLIVDLQNQITELKTQKEDEVAVNGAIDRTTEKIINGFTMENIGEYNRDIQAMTITRTLNLYDATFQDLKSTGNMNLIRNEELKQDVLDFFQFSSRYVYVIRKNAEGYHHFIFEDLMRRELANFDIRGMNEIVRSTGTLPDLINRDIYPEETDYKFNKALLNRLSDIENLQALKNAVNNRRWTNSVALVFLDQMVNGTNNIINELKKELN